MFNYLKWHLSFIKFCSPSLIGDIIDSVSNFITPGVGLAISAGANLLGSTISGNAATDAANTQAAAGSAAQDKLLSVGKQVAGTYAPYQGVGQTGINNLNQMIQSGYLTDPFGPQQLQGNLAPNYQFGLSQGQQANTQASNAAGGGSNVNRSNQMFTQNYAQNAYQKAFDNYLTQKTNLYNQNIGLADIGANAAQNAGNAELGIGTNISNITQGIGNAQAAGQIGTANAYSGAVNNAGNTAALYGLLQNQNTLSNLQNTISGDTTTGNFSDRRLKTNIVKIGQYMNGLNKYSWTYLWGENSTGAMADEVEKLIPEAVKVFYGYKHVNYALLGE